ncbi:aminotransferase class I/II-fold pyridoxal phosphate-dependent enzyme [Gehongia tenuis]|uniref:DegT/DnrJ/EryC1/StrS family aminotransferase n=1 Tax=Gehongia tenuis TaxID=2763655 RepID=A0A926D0Q8_9FIRM|nr:DegT/DnrJ/EryC1/StrS family aminotransferase [Gehongia tenuis]MBC8530230.1 DegT/DnrJ/EryC1/StrS family aminotransferase [Gehongia tenuis]
MRPIHDMLEEYAFSMPLRMHMPGHKGRMPYGPWSWTLDVTELAGTDDLRHPLRGIEAAQTLAARAFGASRTFFLVNGATSGLHALLWTLRPGERVIVSRECHLSVIHGIIMAGLEPVYVEPEWDEEQEICLGMTPAGLRKALAAGPAKAVLATSPNYYGYGCSASLLARMAHDAGAEFWVDQAHGAHWPFYGGLPEDAGKAGADAFVMSAHKTLPAPTQCAYLHVISRTLAERVDETLSRIQTTSPSFLLLGALDDARCFMEEQGGERLRRLYAACRQMEGGLGKGLRALKERPGFVRDRTRIAVDVTERGWTGHEAAAWLEGRGVLAEMADERRVVFLTSVMDEPEDVKRMGDVMNTLPRRAAGKRHGHPRFHPELWAAGEVCGIPDGGKERVPLEQAAGRIAAGSAGAYPPGVPLILPGERIRGKVLEYMVETAKLGGKLFGVNGGITVFKEA